MFLHANKPGHISKEMTNEKAFTKNKSLISKEILLDRAVFHLLMNNHAKWDVMSYVPHITTTIQKSCHLLFHETTTLDAILMQNACA